MSEFKFKKKDSHVHTADLKSDFRKNAIVKRTLNKARDKNEELKTENRDNANDYAQDVIQEKAVNSAEFAKDRAVSAFRKKKTKQRINNEIHNMKNTPHEESVLQQFNPTSKQQGNTTTVNYRKKAVQRNTRHQCTTSKNAKTKQAINNRINSSSHGSKLKTGTHKKQFKVKNNKNTTLPKASININKATGNNMISSKRTALAKKKAQKAYIVIKAASEKAVDLVTNPVKNLGFGALKYLFVLIVVFLLALVTSLAGLFNRQDLLASYESATLSQEVIAYRPLVEQYANEYGIDDYVDILLAIMMQETRGVGNDPMQSSEGAYNTQYPQIPNGIEDPNYSIRCGIQEFKKCLELAECSSPDDISKLYLALQTYNYGPGYIDYAKRGGGFSEANALLYNKLMQQQSNSVIYGDPLYVSHVMRYVNTGNNDIVAIASQEIGNIGGEKYWRWYGFNNHVEWCACFVSWCGEQAGLIEQGKMPKFSGCQVQGVRWFKEHELWMNPEHTPKTGYIIFFDWNLNGKAEHVGIVEKVEDGSVYTIEGNSSDKCRKKSYQLNNSKIMGYGIVQ